MWQALGVRGENPVCRFPPDSLACQYVLHTLMHSCVYTYIYIVYIIYIYIYIYIMYVYIHSNPYNIRPRVICQVTNSDLEIGKISTPTNHLINKLCLLQIIPMLKGFRYKTDPNHSLPNSGQPRVVDNTFEISCGTFRNDSCLSFVIWDICGFEIANKQQLFIGPNTNQLNSCWGTHNLYTNKMKHSWTHIHEAWWIFIVKVVCFG